MRSFLGDRHRGLLLYSYVFGEDDMLLKMNVIYGRIPGLDILVAFLHAQNVSRAFERSQDSCLRVINPYIDILIGIWHPELLDWTKEGRVHCASDFIVPSQVGMPCRISHDYAQFIYSPSIPHKFAPFQGFLACIVALFKKNTFLFMLLKSLNYSS